MLTRIENGKEIVIGDEEEKAVLMFWSLNESYPQYVGHLMFDGVSEPKHDMVECKKRHTLLLKDACDHEMKSITEQIEIAQENGKDIIDLLAQRKSIRSMVSMDLSEINTIDQLVISVPDTLKKYWTKA